MELAVLNTQGKETGRKVVLSDAVFGVEANDHAIYLDVKQYLADQSSGHAQVEAAQRGGRLDPQAEAVRRAPAAPVAAASSLPLFPGGGRVFGPAAPRLQLQAEQEAQAIGPSSSALTYKAKEDADEAWWRTLSMEAPKTKELSWPSPKTLSLEGQKIAAGASRRRTPNRRLCRARNLPNVTGRAGLERLNTYDVMNASAIVMVEGAENVLNTMLA